MPRTKFGPQLHLLDDGFQHRAPGAGFRYRAGHSRGCRDRLLPAGRLREPLTSLASSRCGCAGQRRVSRTDFPLERKTGLARASRHCSRATSRPAGGVLRDCRPENFVLQLRTAGIEPVAEAFYRDHHAYSEKDIRDCWAAAAQRSRTDSSPPKRMRSIWADICRALSRWQSFP